MNPELEAITEFLTGSRTATGQVPWRLLRAGDLRVIRAWATETRPLPSQRRLLQSLRRALAQASEEQAGEADGAGEPSRGALNCRPPRTSMRNRLTAREACLLLDAGDVDTLEGRCDSAIIALMLLGGLRRQEIVALRRGDYDDALACLRVRSRRGATRLLVLEGRCREALEAYLEGADGEAGGALFAGARGDTLIGGGIAPTSVNRLLSRRCREAGCGRVTPRDLRARFLWQVQAGVRSGAGPPCRYQQTEDGEAAWALPSLPTV